MDLAERGFWEGPRKCRGPEACLQLEQTGGRGHGVVVGTRSEGWVETCS